MQNTVHTMDDVQALLREIQGEQPTDVHRASGQSSRNSAKSFSTFRRDELRSSMSGRPLTIGQPVFPKALGAEIPDPYLYDHRLEHLDKYGSFRMCIS